jgi:hypothetical protein
MTSLPLIARWGIFDGYVHYHISGGAFSIKELETLLTFPEFSKFYITTKEGYKYQTSTGNTIDLFDNPVGCRTSIAKCSAFCGL